MEEQLDLFGERTEPETVRSEGQTLLIVDGYGLIYRSYYAFLSHPLTDSDGNNVSAVYGFFNSIMAIIADRKPDYVCIALDSRTKTFRHELYPEYKANRDKAPEDLHAQVPVIEDILSKAGIGFMMQDGMEADDIIATLCKEASKRDMRSLIVTGDKDLMQLVDDKVSILRPVKGGEYMLCTPSEVPGIYGVQPDQILDFLTILGDSSDNVPGIKGIGEKGAVKLLGEYKTLDNVYQHIGELSKGLQAKLEDARAAIPLSRTLITLKDDVYDSVDFPALAISKTNWDVAALSFEKLGLRSLKSAVRKYFGAKPAASGSKEERNTCDEHGIEKEGKAFGISMSDNPVYTMISDLKTLEETLDECVKGGVLALDTETTGTDELRAELLGISFSGETGKAYYVPLSLFDSAAGVLAVFGKKLKNVGIIGQNLKYDYNVLRHNGLVLENLYFDTMIAAWLLNTDAGVYNLDSLAKNMLDYDTVRFEDIVPKGENFSCVPLDKATVYSAEDSDVTFTLYRLLSKRLREENLDNVFFEIEMPLIRVIAEMEYNGIRLDTVKNGALDSYFEQERVKVEKQVFELCGHEFNLNSPVQLQQVLFVERNLPTGKKTQRGFSTDSEVLENLCRQTDDPVPGLILKSRGFVKLKGYCGGLPVLVNPETDRIHPSFLQTGTGTGRLSCRNPNLQNIPVRSDEGRRVRSCFPAEDGCVLLSADYSQIELRVLAHYSQDRALVDAFKNGGDVHRETAATIFSVFPDFVTPEQRRIAKTINFGVIYGMSAFRLSNELGIPRREAQGFINEYFEQYSGVKNFVELTKDEAKKTLSVKTLFGHRRYVAQMGSSNKTEQATGERIAVNTVIQGTAAEIMKKAMIKVFNAMQKAGVRSKMILQIHDELIFEVPEDEIELMKTIVRENMESAVSLSVPLTCGIETADNWGRMH